MSIAILFVSRKGVGFATAALSGFGAFARKETWIAIAVLLLISTPGYAQESNLRVKSISVAADTVQLDSLSIVPASLFLVDNEAQLIDTAAYHLDAAAGLLIWNKNAERYRQLAGKSVEIHYRVFSENFSKKYYHKDYEKALKNLQTPENPYIYSSGQSTADFFRMQGLNKSGSISRGVSFGNNQDVFVNSSLNLQLSGKLNNDIDILAAITDENIPVQPDGNTQQLQEFDKVFIQLSSKRSKLIAGDFELRRPNSYFMNFYKKAQGGSFSTSMDVLRGKDSVAGVNSLAVAGAVSKGKQARNTSTINTSGNTFNGTNQEGNQGPYRLRGNNNETFIIVIAGSERIYIDGRPLERGQQYDYVIDYNTAQITFTPKRIITKDSRISVEFEYSDRNYSRTLLFFGDEFTRKNLRMNFNVYSEQDSKNQPLQIELDSAKQALLNSVGDSINSAIYPSYDSVAYSNNEVLYAKKDSLGFQNVFYYTTDTTLAHWRVSFSFVGPNGGDYVPDANSANGKVYRWVAPVNGVRQGSYVPAILIVTPKKQQMFTFGTDYTFSKSTRANVEVAMSNYDVNLFSDKDKGNDVGLGVKSSFLNVTPLKHGDSSGWIMTSSLNYEYVQKNFKPIERYRTVEFEREWNLTASTNDDEHIASAEVGFSKKSLGNIAYQLRSFRKGSPYSGLNNSIGTNLTWKKFRFLADGSYLTTKNLNNRTEYYKHKADLSRLINKFVVGVHEEEEHNSFFKSSSDTLFGNSFAFREYSGYFGMLDSLKNTFKATFKQRYDYSPDTLGFKLATVAQDVSLATVFSRNPNNSLRTTTVYRKLAIEDSTLTQQEANKTLLNRIEHNLALGKGLITANTFYEIGTGQEQKQEFSYLEVVPGQGVYQWIDYNGNNIKELNEFEIAAFPGDAKYVKILVPTNEYVTARTNSFSEVVSVNPAASQKMNERKNFITRFSDQFQLQLNRKNVGSGFSNGKEIARALNPFEGGVNDITTLSSNSSYRNTVFYNRTSSIYGADYSYQQLESKSLLVNGTESRTQTTHTGNARWNINRFFLLQSSYEKGDKTNYSEFFASRRYHIVSQKTEPKLSYQPGTSFRTTLSYLYAEKRNVQDTANERSFSNKLQLESRYSTVTAGSVSAHISYTHIKFNADENSSLAYDMLEGLHKGENIVWGLSLQRNLSSALQLSLNYDGRKSEGVKPVHTANVQLRALF